MKAGRAENAERLLGCDAVRKRRGRPEAAAVGQAVVPAEAERALDLQPDREFGIVRGDHFARRAGAHDLADLHGGEVGIGLQPAALGRIEGCVTHELAGAGGRDGLAPQLEVAVLEVAQVLN